MLKKLSPMRTGLLPPDLFDDHLVGRFRVGLIKHNALVAGAFENRRKRHDADRRKTHNTNIAISSASRCRQGIELWIANVNQKYAHQLLIYDFALGSHSRAGAQVAPI